jgi:ATP-binding cassette subfamily B protein/subfamily B ATP-binding cassette protein MsbA
MRRVASNTWRWLGDHVRGEWSRLSVGATAMALRAGVLLLLPWPLKFIIDSVIFRRPLGHWAATILPNPLTHRLELLQALGAAILLLGLAEAGLAYIGNRLLLDAALRIGYGLRRDFFAQLLRLPLAFHRRHLSGELAARIGGDINALQNFFAAIGIDLFPHLLTICGVLGVMLAMNWRYGLLTLAIAPVLVWIARHFSAAIRRAARAARRNEGEQSGATQEVLGNVLLVQTCAREDYEEQRFAERGRTVLDAALLGNRVQAGFAPAMNLAIAVATGLIAWYGAGLVIRGALSAGDLLVFLAYLRAIAAPARQLAKAGRTFGRASVALERLDEYRREHSTISDGPTPQNPRHCTGKLEFRQVTFGYTPQIPTVRDISFALEPGRLLALVGPTGSGKSTLAALAARFNDPDAGQVLLDGFDLTAISLRFVRTRVVLIPQEAQLFHGPLWANIAYGRAGAGRREAIEAAARAGLEAMISGLPGGFDLMIGEHGSGLSGGQRQCVAVVRALLSEAAVVILDEPSSSIDPVTEQRLMLAVRRLAEERSVLMIAHRLATVAAADLILVLQGGRIVQRGRHEQLLAEGGAYARLWQANGGPTNVTQLRRVVS